MKKSVVTFTIIILTLFSLFALPVMAENGGEFGDNLTWSINDDGVLTISGSSEMPNYTYPNHTPWYNYRDSIRSVVIVNGVNSIGDYAFCYYDRLTSIVIPESVVSIGDFAFNGCSGLTNLILPDCVTSIGNYSFSDCSNLNSVNLSKGMKRIENRAFMNCEKLVSVEIPDGITTIGFEAFCNCSNLEKIMIPNSVISIEGWAFRDCVRLKSVDIPNSVTNIGGSAFLNCRSLISVTIPESVTNIEVKAFGTCVNLNSINVSANNTQYSSQDGVLFNKSKTTLIQFPSGKSGAYIIPNTVTNIGIEAFSNNSNIVSIEIPNGVISIGNSAFSGCNNITSFVIPESVESLGSNAFYNCAKLFEINVSENNLYFMSIDGVLFNKEATILIQCPSGIMGEYIMPETVTRILDFAFYHCSLTSVTISNRVQTVGYNTFSKSSNLNSVKIGNSVTSIGAGAFNSCENLVRIEIPNNVTKISYHAFSDCNNLTSIKIGENVKDIEYFAFSNCNKLTDVFYSGNEEDWNSVNIGSDNECLKNALRHYVPSMKVTAEGKNITVLPKNFNVGNVVIIAAYKNNTVTDIQIKIYNNESVLFLLSAPYDTVKAMGWNNLTSMMPLCQPEIIKIKQSSSGSGGIHT